MASLLTAVACLLLACAAVLAYAMARPVRWDGPGIVGALALFFPLHLLLITAACVALAWLAQRSGAALGAAIFGLTALLTAGMAIVPAAAVRRYARALGVPVSLGNYLANALLLNYGRAQPARSVVYGVAPDGVALKLDVWRTGLADDGPLRPAVVLVHGGAWNYGNRSMMPVWNRWLNRLGYEVFDVEYRMPPPERWRDEIGDVKSALGWLAAHAADYHVDPTRISVMGGSAGANLSLLAAYTVNDAALPPSTGVAPVNVRCVINIYGPTDMALLYRVNNSPAFVRPDVRAYIGGTPEEFPDRYRAVSPLTHVSAQCPPTLTLTGTHDRLVPAAHATLLDEALAAAGVTHETYLLPATDHGFDVNWGGFATQIARQKVRTFLQKHG
jgi:acetyl esterase/lipase